MLLLRSLCSWTPHPLSPVGHGSPTYIGGSPTPSMEACEVSLSPLDTAGSLPQAQDQGKSRNQVYLWTEKTPLNTFGHLWWHVLYEWYIYECLRGTFMVVVHIVKAWWVCWRRHLRIVHTIQTENRVLSWFSSWTTARVSVHPYTSNDIVSECGVIQNHIHPIAVPEKDTVSIATRPNLKIERMSTIYIV